MEIADQHHVDFVWTHQIHWLSDHTDRNHELIYFSHEQITSNSRCQPFDKLNYTPMLAYLPQKELKAVYQNRKDGQKLAIYSDDTIQTFDGWIQGVGQLEII